MITMEQRCLMGSAAAHAGLVIALMVASLVATRRAFDPAAMPPIELVSLEGVRITDGSGAGGGTPTPPPPAPPRNATRPVDPPVRPTSPPVQEAPKEPVRPPATPPAPPRVERAVQVSQDVKKAQDVDPSLKGKSKPETSKDSDKRSRRIEVAKAAKGPSAEDLAAEKAAAAAEAHRVAAQAAQERWRKAVGGIHSKLSEQLSGETTITVPGPGGGGEVWIGYATYLKSFYEVRWRRPSSLPAPVAYVGVSITVARDGRLLRAELLEKSGIRELDDSVNEVIQRYRRLEPLPPGAMDSERTFRIKFRLEGGSQ
jgi:TonB family protein